MGNRELFPLHAEKPEPIDLKPILRRYLRFWYIFVFGTVLALGIAYVYLQYFTVPLYSVSSTILIKDEKAGSGSSGADAFSDLSMFKSSKNMDNEIEVLHSKSLMERVVKELSLYTSFYVEGKFRDKEIYGSQLPVRIIVDSLAGIESGKAFSIQVNSGNSFKLDDHQGSITTHRYGEKIEKPFGVFRIKKNKAGAHPFQTENKKITILFRDILNVAAYYNQAINIGPVNKNASVLRVSVVDPIPERGKDIVNKLIEVYDKDAIEDKNKIASNTLEFIDERLKYITDELTEVERDVEQFKRHNELTDVNTQASNYLSQESNYNVQLSDWAVQIDILESIERYLNKANSQYRTVPSSLGIQDPTLQSLIAQFNSLQMDRERMLRTLHPNNPLIENIDEQLAVLRKDILENLANIKESLVITSTSLKEKSGQFQARIKKVPSMERELLEINRQQAIKQNLYLYLLQKKEETSLSLAATVSNSRVIDPAVERGILVAPNKSMVYLMGILLGLGLPFVGLYVSEILNNKVQTLQDVKKITRTPVLGELSHNTSKNMLVLKKGNHSPLAEMFRLIRAKLQFSARGKDYKVIMVSSSMSGEGKTFFSINLGGSLVMAGKKVLLLELDLRKPDLVHGLGMEEGLGITDYLNGDKVSVHELIRPVYEMPGLYIIGSGAYASNPAELMMSSKLAHLINELKHNFDHIIIDTPPIGQVADAFGISSLIDSTIYLVRCNYTFKKQIQIIDEIYRNRELNHPMIVLNDAKLEMGYGYGYGYTKPGKQKKTTAVKKQEKKTKAGAVK